MDELNNTELKEHIKVKWEKFKIVAKSVKNNYCVMKAKSRQNKLVALEKRLKNLKSEISNINLFIDKESEISAIENEIQELHDYKTKGIMLRSKCDWYQYGEKIALIFMDWRKIKRTEGASTN